MDNSDYPTSPYSKSEQKQIMRDVEASRITALKEGDEERFRQLETIKLNK